jgi:hypothetical protein
MYAGAACYRLSLFTLLVFRMMRVYLRQYDILDAKGSSRNYLCLTTGSPADMMQHREPSRELGMQGAKPLSEGVGIFPESLL